MKKEGREGERKKGRKEEREWEGDDGREEGGGREGGWVVPRRHLLLLQSLIRVPSSL